MKALSLFREITLRILSRLSFVPPLVARITLAGVFIESGWGKIHNITKVIGYFTELGIPAPVFQAHLVAYTEFLCGSAILLGLLTRLASIPVIATMTVAILTAKKSDIQSLTDIFGFSEFLYIVLCVYLIFEGPGLFSLDTILNKFFLPRNFRNS